VATLCNLLNIQHDQKTAYHLQSNRLVEWLHHRLKDALRACCATENWTDHLPWVLLGLRSAAREDDNNTPTQAVFGSPLILPGQFLDSPELPSYEFLTQFSRTLCTPKHYNNRQNTAATQQPPSSHPAATRQPLPKLPDALLSATTV
jgi:hypothetical protein